jgi:hypothetical protein
MACYGDSFMALVRPGVSEKCIASIIRVKRISELGTILADEMFLRNVGSYKSNTASSQKTAFFIVTAVKTSQM